jgi:Flp pilus assembly protein TadG
MKNIFSPQHEFWRDEAGTTSVEFVLWFPIVMSLVLMFADVSTILFQRSNTVRIVEDAHRMRSVGILTSDVQTQDYIISKLGTVYSTKVGVNSIVTAGTQMTVISIPIDSIDLLGVFVEIVGKPRIDIVSQQFIENWEA